MLVTVDTGGTKTLIALFGRDGQVHDTAKFPTPKKQSEYVAVLRRTLQEKYANKPVDAIVIALPGIVKDGVAVWCDNLGWKDFDAQQAFAGVLGDAPVWIENDANLAGLAEARALDPIPTSVLYVTIGTGIGTGMITNGQIDPGLRLSEGGRMIVEFEGKMREWEDFASGRAIYETFGQYAHDITSQRIWQQIADRISRGLLVMIPVIQPNIVVIGGGIGSYFPKYALLLEVLLRKKLPPHIPCPHLLQAQHPEQAVIYGCYYYALDFLAAQ